MSELAPGAASRRLTVCLVFVAVLFTACASGPDYFEGPAAPSYENTPSSAQLQRAQEAYRAGRYATALEYYKLAAYWADKFAQYNVAVMYLQGKGMERDLARGWAWLELSAERGYPQMAGPAGDIYPLLDEEIRQEARQILGEELLPEYGDEVAIERTARRMDRNRRVATGSNTGSTAGLGRLTVIDGRGVHSGTQYYDDSRWDFEQIVEAETRFMFNWARGTIGLGEMELHDDEPEGEGEQR
ncbi:hypothetical protein [Natronospira bacteriovora]|uniref:Sel1 repeat family protein n=1 Tax=Natronospira bacteriovora TaxID=3069753 RepID=A0ABU0W4K4_9GAMM|nr:hypothetical protein [Natronospira sp. AB-CW4]MDQ2068897.1 hypothetical protein [Natronospira sp. AB-CW4]